MLRSLLGSVPSHKREIAWRALAAMSCFACVYLFARMALGSSLVDAAPGLRLEAPAYVWTRDCPKGDYTRRLEVPDGCVRSEYHLVQPGEVGLRWNDKAYDWYRVGPDALLLSCFGVSRCILQNYVKDRFREPAEIEAGLIVQSHQ